jgi:hypothetical protein
MGGVSLVATSFFLSLSLGVSVMLYQFSPCINFNP